MNAEMTKAKGKIKYEIEANSVALRYLMGLNFIFIDVIILMA